MKKTFLSICTSARQTAWNFNTYNSHPKQMDQSTDLTLVSNTYWMA